MSADPIRRVDRGGASAAEALLREARIGSQAEKDALAELLAAATAPARDHELAGERSALAAFREARRAAVAAAARLDDPALPARAARVPVRLPRRWPAALRLRVVRAATLGLATATAAGVAAIAFAAGTGDLPAALRGEGAVHNEHTPSASGVSPSTSPYGTGPSAGAGAEGAGPGFGPGRVPGPWPNSGSPAGGGTGGTDETGGTYGNPGGHETYRGPAPYPSGPTSPLGDPDAEAGESSLRRLCRAYLRDADMSKRQTRKLSEAAGGRKKVRDYCVRKLDTEAGEKDGTGSGPDGRSGDTDGRGGSGDDGGSSRDDSDPKSRTGWYDQNSQNDQNDQNGQDYQSQAASSPGREVASLPPRLPPSARFTTSGSEPPALT